MFCQFCEGIIMFYCQFCEGIKWLWDYFYLIIISRRFPKFFTTSYVNIELAMREYGMFGNMDRIEIMQMV